MSSAEVHAAARACELAKLDNRLTMLLFTLKGEERTWVEIFEVMRCEARLIVQGEAISANPVHGAIDNSARSGWRNNGANIKLP